MVIEDWCLDHFICPNCAVPMIMETLVPINRIANMECPNHCGLGIVPR
jgi:hypothetical protein